MVDISITKDGTENLIKLWRSCGDDEFVKKIVGKAMVMSVNDDQIDSRYMDMSMCFTKLYLKTAREEYKTIGNLFRRAAHIVKRQLDKVNEGRKHDARFLRAV